MPEIAMQFMNKKPAITAGFLSLYWEAKAERFKVKR